MINTKKLALAIAILGSGAFTVASCSDDAADCNPQIYYLDADGDGLGSANIEYATAACEQPSGYVTNFDDPIDIDLERVWSNNMITFTKENNADYTLEANQDRITDNVHITRKEKWPIYNIAVEDLISGPGCSDDVPEGTRWAIGDINNLENLQFSSFLGNAFADCDPTSILNKDAVLHLVKDDIYIKIKFTSWSQSGSGGGFSYERATTK